MTIFASAPDASTRSAFASFNNAEFDLVIRAVELVAQAQAFSPLGLQRALRLTPPMTARITSVLQLLAVIEPFASGRAASVLVRAEALPVLLPQLRAHWRDSRMSNAA